MLSFSTNLIDVRGGKVALGGLFVMLLIGALTDLRSRRIPNLLTLPAALLAIILHAGLDGAWGGVSALLGYLAWFLGGYSFYRWVGGIGAGDIKLLMSCAAFVGMLPALYVAFVSFMLQTIWLFVGWLAHGTGIENFRRLGYWLYSCLVPGVRITHFQAVGAPDRSPHGPFILAGAVGTVLLWGEGYVRF